MELCCPLCVTVGAKCVQIHKLSMRCECDACGAHFTIQLDDSALVRSEAIVKRRRTADPTQKREG